MDNIVYKRHEYRKAFSLAEMLAALIITAMILVAVLAIYSRAENSAGAIIRKLDSSRLPSEVLQRITEDVDRLIANDSATKVTVTNKLENGFATARLEIVRSIYGTDDKKLTFEDIIWQGSYDGDTQSLVLYRSHSGIESEDKLLDKEKENWEKELFVPICTGVTFFKIQVSSGENLQDQWSGESLPQGLVVTISFAEPFKTVAGNFEVPQTEQITRTVAVDRTRKIQFNIPKQGAAEGQKLRDANEPKSRSKQVRENIGVSR